MVKSAAIEATPLLTAEERVNSAVERISAGRSLTDETVEMAGVHPPTLVQNLSIERDDFDIVRFCQITVAGSRKSDLRWPVDRVDRFTEQGISSGMIDVVNKLWGSVTPCVMMASTTEITSSN